VQRELPGRLEAAPTGRAGDQGKGAWVSHAGRVTDSTGTKRHSERAGVTINADNDVQETPPGTSGRLRPPSA
jgi:hypothetical protein